MRPPRLVAAIGLAVAFDLPIDSLEALADRVGDLLDRLPGMKAVGDGDAVVLGEEAGRDGTWVRYQHPASVEEPQ